MELEDDVIRKIADNFKEISKSVISFSKRIRNNELTIEHGLSFLGNY